MLKNTFLLQEKLCQLYFGILMELYYCYANLLEQLRDKINPPICEFNDQNSWIAIWNSTSFAQFTRYDSQKLSCFQNCSERFLSNFSKKKCVFFAIPRNFRTILVMLKVLGVYSDKVVCSNDNMRQH